MATGLKGALESLRNAIGDLTSLEVQTLTGDLKAVVETGGAASDKPHSGGSIVNWTEAIKSARTKGEVKLVAATIINFDGDATQFIASGEIAPHLLEAHQAALEAGHRVRAELLDLARDALDLK